MATGELTALRRYLEAVRASLAPLPALHRNQLAAVTRLAAAAASAEDAAQVGDCFELTRGLHLDRLAVLARVADELDDPWLVGALLVEQDAVLACDGARDYSARTLAAMTAAMPAREASARARGGFARLVVSTLRSQLEPDDDVRAAAAEDARGLYAQILAVDPSFPGELPTRTRYRQHLPFGPRGCAQLVQWIHALGAGFSHTPPPPPVSVVLADLGDGARRWRASFDERRLVPTQPGAVDPRAPYRALVASLDALPQLGPEAAAMRTAARVLAAWPTPDDAPPFAPLADWVAGDHLVELSRAPLRAQLAAAIDDDFATAARAALATTRSHTAVELIAELVRVAAELDTTWRLALRFGASLRPDAGEDAPPSPTAPGGSLRSLLP